MGEPHDEKVMNREIGRLRMSLQAAEPGLEKLVFLHYPPVYTGTSAPEIVATLKEFGIKTCFYGHLHGNAIRFAVQGEVDGIRYKLVSADGLSLIHISLKIISEGSIKAEKPQFNVGDTVRVDVRIKDGDRERIQAFEGTVIAKKHGGVAETFTVRRVAYGVGIERVFPINSPFVEKVTVVRKGKVRRAKLFYLRGRTGKAAKVKSDI